MTAPKPREEEVERVAKALSWNMKLAIIGELGIRARSGGAINRALTTRGFYDDRGRRTPLWDQMQTHLYTLPEFAHFRAQHLREKSQ